MKKHYLVLTIGLILGSGLILFVRFNPVLKQLAIISLSVFYLVWGIVHHQLTDHLRLKVVLEYLLVAILGFVIINTLL